MADSLVILGPTACGKTALAVCAASSADGEVLSADSRQVYRGLDLGSGKDLCEYCITENGQTREIPYHLIDIADLRDEYSVYDYRKDFFDAFDSVRSRGKLPVVCGGTGMYLDSIIRGYRLVRVPTNQNLRDRFSGASMEELADYLCSIKPDLHNHTDLTERHRLLRAIEIELYTRETAKETVHEENPRKINPVIIGITFPRDVLRKRITARLRERLGGGMIEEVRLLHENGVPWDRLERLGLEYRFIAEFLQGKIASCDELFRSLNTAIGQFAKRQETWFRGMERKGVAIRWLPASICAETDSRTRNAAFIAFVSELLRQNAG